MKSQESLIAGLATNATPLGGLTAEHVDKIIKKIASFDKGMVAPLLMDYCSLLGAIDFEASCNKYDVQGMIGTRVSVQVDGEVLDDVVIIAKNQSGFEELSEFITRVNNHQHNIDKLNYTESDISLGGWTYKTCLPLDLLLLSDDVTLVFSERDRLVASLAAYSEQENVEELINLISGKGIRSNSLGGKVTHGDGVVYIHRVSLDENSNHELFSKNLRPLKKLMPSREYDVELTSKSNTGYMYRSGGVSIPSIRQETARLINEVEVISLAAEEVMPDVDFGIDIKSEAYAALADKLAADPSLDADKYEEYLAHEMETLREIDGDGYYQMVIAFSRYAREHGSTWRLRGSASASLVFNLLGVSSELIDPVAEGLVLDRFITKGRQEKPDVDFDLPNDERHLFISFVELHYGKGSVVSFANKNGTKSFLKLMEKALELKGSDIGVSADYLKSINNDVKNEIEAYDPTDMHISNVIEKSKLLQALISNNSVISELVSDAVELGAWENSLTSHQSGMIFSPNKLFKFPLMSMANGWKAMECVKPSKAGYVKFDILSSRNVQLLREIDKILDKQGISVDKKPNFDKAFFDFFCKNTAFLNQMGGDSMTTALEKIKPQDMLELLISMALPRPVLSRSDRDLYYERKAGRSEYPDTAMFKNATVMNIIKPTYGFILFDEQILELCNHFSGLDETYSDKIRTAIKKGNMDVFLELKEVFVGSALEKGESKEVAEQVYAVLERAVGRYSFPKAHALSYAIIAMEQCYRKLMHPAETYSAFNKVFPYNSKTKDKYKKAIEEFEGRGISLSCPCIKESQRDDFVLKDAGGESIMHSPLSPVFKGVKKYGDIMLDAIDKLHELDMIKTITVQEFIDLSADLFSKESGLDDLKEKDVFKDCINRMIYFGVFDSTGFTQNRVFCESRIEAREMLMSVADGYIDDSFATFPALSFDMPEIGIDVFELAKLEFKLFGTAVTHSSNALSVALKPELKLEEKPVPAEHVKNSVSPRCS